MNIPFDKASPDDALFLAVDHNYLVDCFVVVSCTDHQYFLAV